MSFPLFSLFALARPPVLAALLATFLALRKKAEAGAGNRGGEPL